MPRKLTYDEMKLLSEAGLGDTGKIVVKNRKGRVLRPTPATWHLPKPRPSALIPHSASV
jgi:hypothetical protein